MKTGIKRASAFWHRFVAILKNKTVVPEAFNIERGMNRMKFDSFENNIQRKRQVSSLENMYVTPKIFGVELDNLRQLLAYFIGIWRKTSAYQIRTFQYGQVWRVSHVFGIIRTA